MEGGGDHERMALSGVQEEEINCGGGSGEVVFVLGA